MCDQRGKNLHNRAIFATVVFFLAFERVLFSCWINIWQNLISNKLIRVKLQEDVRRRNREEMFANICAILIKMLPKQ